MAAIKIASIVEGYGEIEAVPKLLQRIKNEVAPGSILITPSPIRLPEGRMKNRLGELERMVQLAAAKIENKGAILILVDADDDCPAQLGPNLLERAQAVRSDIPMAAVIANREFESWFVAAIESLTGIVKLPQDFQPPSDPEVYRDAKGWLQEYLRRKYVPTIDQPAFASAFDLEIARRTSHSFDKFYRDVTRLLGAGV